MRCYCYSEDDGEWAGKLVLRSGIGDCGEWIFPGVVPGKDCAVECVPIILPAVGLPIRIPDPIDPDNMLICYCFGWYKIETCCQLCPEEN